MHGEFYHSEHQYLIEVDPCQYFEPSFVYIINFYSQGFLKIAVCSLFPCSPCTRSVSKYRYGGPEKDFKTDDEKTRVKVLFMHTSNGKMLP